MSSEISSSSKMGWGGARPHSGGARPNSGGARPNSGGARANSGGVRAGAGRKPGAFCAADSHTHAHNFSQQNSREYAHKNVAFFAQNAAQNGHQTRWYCVRTRLQSERIADIEISLKGFTVFAPSLFKPATPARRAANGAIIPARPDRVVPLFPRYLFVQFNRGRDPWHLIQDLPEVEAILKSPSGQPTPVPDAAIARLRELLSPNGCLYPPDHHAPPMEVGTTARLLAGPMADLAGVCTWSDGRRVRLLMEIMGRPVPVTVAQGAVEPV